VDYAWTKESHYGELTPVAEADGPACHIEALCMKDAGLYRCVVSDAVAVAQSDPVELIVLPGAPAARGLGLTFLTVACALGAAIIFGRSLKVSSREKT